MSKCAPTTLPVRLPCRFHGHAQAVFLVAYEEGCICFPDPVQALCEQHTVKGLQNNEGRIIARLRKDVAS